MIELIVLFVSLGYILYLLYINGYVIISHKTALLFVGKLYRKNSSKAEFISCNGTVKRMLRFKENQSVYFQLESQITEGDFSVEILDKNKQILLHLDSQKSEGWMHVEEKKNYILVFSFKSTSGSYYLNWK